MKTVKLEAVKYKISAIIQKHPKMRDCYKETANSRQCYFIRTLKHSNTHIEKKCGWFDDLNGNCIDVGFNKKYIKSIAEIKPQLDDICELFPPNLVDRLFLWSQPLNHENRAYRILRCHNADPVSIKSRLKLFEFVPSNEKNMTSKIYWEQYK